MNRGGFIIVSLAGGGFFSVEASVEMGHPGGCFDSDAGKALRFHRQRDAEAFASIYCRHLGTRVMEVPDG